MQHERLLDRARVHAALGDSHRLAIVDELVLSDRAPSELRAALGIGSNLLAHHLDVLERVGLVQRLGSQGDRRRRYVRLVPGALGDLAVGGRLRAGRLVFVCTENMARSQLAAVLWNHLGTPIPAMSGGTRPSGRVHPRAVAAAARRGLDLGDALPGPVPHPRPLDLLITVCDRAHEALRRTGAPAHLHWSIPDPVRAGGGRAFDAAADLLDRRIRRLEPLVRPA